jgi:RNA polymerase sigma-70 factor (ECF subfamily)
VHDIDDGELVRRFVHDGDERAFRLLYRAHVHAMFAIAWRLTDGNRADADDIVQEAWIRASGRLSGFRWESTLRTWLIGITVNCARSRFRRHAGRTARDVDLASVAELPSPAPVSALSRIDLERAIAELPDGYREVVILHDVFGHTHDEIAEMLGLESGTSKSQLSRARATLRRWLGEKGTEHERRSQEPE